MNTRSQANLDCGSRTAVSTRRSRHSWRSVWCGMLILAGIATGQEPAGKAWRSRLYPEAWTPGMKDSQGHFIHDMSYAGYRNGEAPIPAPTGPVFDVVDGFGADGTGQQDATPALQKAVDAARTAGGGVVRIPPGQFRCDQDLRIEGSGVVLRGAGPGQTRLFFTSVPAKGWRNHITIRGRIKESEERPLAADGQNLSDEVVVESADNLAVGDDVAVGWVITDAFIKEHGMTGTWRAFNGKWRPFFLRTVTGIDRSAAPHRIALDVPLRYQAKTRDRASLRKVSGYISGCGIEDLAISNAVSWQAAWSRAGVHAIGLSGVMDCWVRNVHSFASPLEEAKGFHLQNGGILVVTSKRVTIAHCHMRSAQNRGGGGAGYLFQVSRSNEILTRDCTGMDGRHNFIQNWDFGTTGCVWLRCLSRGSRCYANVLDPIGWRAFCEYHHSLAMACVVDQCTLDDGWFWGNRNNWSSGAGNTVTQSVYWNTSGKGAIRSWQHGMGYIIGTTDITVQTELEGKNARNTAPEDVTEGLGKGRWLVPQSLYEDQLRRRLAKP